MSLGNRANGEWVPDSLASNCQSVSIRFEFAASQGKFALDHATNAGPPGAVRSLSVYVLLIIGHVRLRTMARIDVIRCPADLTLLF